MNLKNNVLVLGAARSGIAATKALLKWDMNVSLVDDRPLDKLNYFLQSGLQENQKLKCYFAELYPPINNHSLVVLSPGISKVHPLVLQAQNSGIKIVNEMDLALKMLSDATVVGITGTNGKSSTTIMMETIFKEAGLKAVAAGNIGLPICDLILQNSSADHLILELSSFQLDTLQTAELDAAIILNISPNHLDHYSSMNDYVSSKLKIIDLIKDNGHLIVNKNLDDLIKNHPRLDKINTHFFTREDWEKEQWQFLHDNNLAGEHYQENAMAAASASLALNIHKLAIVKALQKFRPLEFRCQLIAQKNGISYINDSKATTVEAVKRALSMSQNPVHLLLGGISKGESFAPLASFEQICGFYVYGQSKDNILRELNDQRTLSFADLPSAFLAAQSRAKANEIILLSPACASYDQFSDYEDRGRTFNRLVAEIDF